MEAVKGRKKPKKRDKNKLRVYQYNGRRPLTIIYKDEKIVLERGDTIPLTQLKLTVKLWGMLDEVDE